MEANAVKISSVAYLRCLGRNSGGSTGRTSRTSGKWRPSKQKRETTNTFAKQDNEDKEMETKEDRRPTQESFADAWHI